MNTTEFKNKARIKHNNLYDYTNTVYHNAKTKVVIICKIHGEFNQAPYSHLKGFGCAECANIKRRATNLERYGSTSPLSGYSVRNKIKQTNLERYGSETPFGKNSTILHKVKTTNLERYGDVSPVRKGSPIRDKIKQTNLDRYGAEHTWSSKSTIFCNKQQTYLERFGAISPFGNHRVQEKIKQTNIERYGCENPAQSPIIQEKIKQTNIERYGVIYHTQKHMMDAIILLQNYDWLYEQYIIKARTSQSIATELNISFSTVLDYARKLDIPIREPMSEFSHVCIGWLESIMKQEGIVIQHALNGGEYKIPGTRFKADGYCQETNTIYEFHGDCFHGNPVVYKSHEICSPFSDLTAGELYTKTIEREELIISLGYNLVVMWENEFSWYSTYI